VLSASAQYPTKPVRIVTGGTGSNSDFAARVLANALTGTLSQQVIVENRPSGVILGEIVAKAAPDAYTLLVSGSSFWLAPYLQPKVPWDPVKDFAPVILASTAPNLIVVHPSMQVKSVKELIALAKQKPGELTFASSGLGGAPHLTGELFALTTGIKLVHVPYKGGVPAITDLAGGRVSMSFPTLTTSLAFIKNGSLRPLAVLSKERSAYLPDVPTMAEAGVPNVVVRDWQGILAPRGVPKPIVDKLVTDIRRVLKDPANQERFASSGFEVIASTPAEFRAALTSEIQRWARVVKDAHIKLE
jgi:tripartite-type tricarboxylate transporter receptor subunit TctC